MNQQFLFNLYAYVVTLLVVSLLACVLGRTGVAGALNEVLTGSRIGLLSRLAFGLFLAQVVWQRIANLELPIRSWKECWPVLLACCFFFVGRSLRPRRFRAFLKARKLYEDYRRHVPSKTGIWPPRHAEPTDEMKEQAASDARLNRALSLYKEAITLSRNEGGPYDVAVGEYHMGMVLYLQGKFSEAAAAFNRCLQLVLQLRRDVNMEETVNACRYYLGVIETALRMRT